MAEEVVDERDDMLIDRFEPEGNKIPEGFNADYLKVYYGKLFPYAEIYKWMSYGHDGKHPACDLSYFGRREFSFSLDNDILVRYQSFSSAVQMENSIKDKCPFKIDIGAVYSVDPAKRHAYAGDNVFTPVERELVFDVDMTDYDDVRYCCSGADVCLKCWPLMTIAIKVIDKSLRGLVLTQVDDINLIMFFGHNEWTMIFMETFSSIGQFEEEDFGFNHILWVFSGRRGVHCWVCDGRARRLTDEVRSAIAEYFRVYKGNENTHKKVFLGGGQVLHPFLARSYTEVLRPFFEETLVCSQDLFVIEERFEKILQLIPDESVAAELRGKWLENRRSSISKGDVNVTRWEQLKHLLQSGRHKMGLRRCIEEIVFTYTYPRIDIGVSKLMNHLLKAPFCIHPKTGRVCVPIDPDHCEEFDPTAVPTLSTLLEELNRGGSRGAMENELDRTSLGKSVRFFRSSFLHPLLKSCKEEMESSYNAKLQQSKKNLLSW